MFLDRQSPSPRPGRHGRLHRRAALLSGLTLVLSAPACTSGEAPAAQAGGRGGRGTGIVPVTVVVAAQGSAARSVVATGIVEPLRTIGVNSQLAGVISLVTAQEGDVVSEGALLARIETPELEAQLASAEAALSVAQSQADRSAALFGQQIITAAEHERDQAALVAARATRDQLKTRLGYAAVLAPVSGVVMAKRVEAGALASAQSRLFSVADVSTLVVRVPISELDVTALREGMPVRVTLDALPGRELQGSVRRVFPAADSVTRLVPVEVAISGSANRDVRPGFLARARFALSPRTNVLLVPGAALLQNPRGAAVYVVSGGKAALRPVERGATFDGRVEITSGLAIGDSVVVAGNTMLRDGAEVRIAVAPSDSVRPTEGAGRAVGVTP
ncbi:MAG: efflux RND transporter periplasmic adaptor subunit [Gemmatimonadaceae bacterium]